MEHSFAHNALPGSLELAFLGDTIYDLYVRRHLVRRGGRVQTMHREAASLVCAHAQSAALSRVEDALSEEEEYHRATSLEALIGYLYLTGRRERIDELMRAALPEEYAEESNEE